MHGKVDVGWDAMNDECWSRETQASRGISSLSPKVNCQQNTQYAPQDK